MIKKFIFITGGVVSGLGKGISAASIGAILKTSGKSVFIQKCDPYLNIDPGTISPLQHGEVFVTNDGAETDLDLGHYERFIDQNLTKSSNITAGQIYQTILNKERNGNYIGETIQVIPHVTNAIKDKIYEASLQSKAEFSIIEIGGTVGDIESLPFLEAIRQIKMEKGHDNVLFAHVGLLPYIDASKEHKTKPIQHSVKMLLSLGIQPDVIITRSKKVVTEVTTKKIALFCNVQLGNVINAYDVESIYDIPVVFHQQNIHKIISSHFNCVIREPNMKTWIEFGKTIKKSAANAVKVKIVGKYTEMTDAYLSVIESLHLAGYQNNVKADIIWIDSTKITKNNYETLLNECDGILIPGGFGERGIEGMILAAKYARENDIPYLGLCLGMQIACIEFARNVCDLKKANSLEFTKTPNAIFHILPGKNQETNLGGTLRLGNYLTTIKKGTLLFKIYKSATVLERHRHRYEFNNKFKSLMEKKGLIFSGIYSKENLVEVVEYSKHKFYISSQFHPEFKSRPNKPAPLFDGFIKAML